MKTKALISCAVTVKQICFFVFTYVKIRFSDDMAQFIVFLRTVMILRFQTDLSAQNSEPEQTALRGAVLSGSTLPAMLSASY